MLNLFLGMANWWLTTFSFCVGVGFCTIHCLIDNGVHFNPTGFRGSLNGVFKQLFTSIVYCIFGWSFSSGIMLNLDVEVCGVAFSIAFNGVFCFGLGLFSILKLVSKSGISWSFDWSLSAKSSEVMSNGSFCISSSSFWRL